MAYAYFRFAHFLLKCVREPRHAAHRHSDRASEIEDLVARGRAFTGDEVRLVVAIDVIFVSPVTDGFALQ